jgi:cystathionine beta-lyase
VTWWNARWRWQDGKAEMDFAAWEALLTGRERMLILCSPHNPGGRVWTVEELRKVAAFCEKHDLILVSDEIHNDLVFPGQKHTVMANAAPEIANRLVMLTASTKTFNIAGAHIGNVIIADPDLRKTFAQTMDALGISPNSFGMHMVTAAYSPEGAAWVDDLMRYLDGNRKLFDEGIARIPGLRSTQLEATYLAWVDFSGTGMTAAEFIDRVQKTAKIATNYGASFGKGGETYLRFNIACPRAQVVEAVARWKGPLPICNDKSDPPAHLSSAVDRAGAFCGVVLQPASRGDGPAAATADGNHRPHRDRKVSPKDAAFPGRYVGADLCHRAGVHACG